MAEALPAVIVPSFLEKPAAVCPEVPSRSPWMLVGIELDDLPLYL